MGEKRLFTKRKQHWSFQVSSWKIVNRTSSNIFVILYNFQNSSNIDKEKNRIYSQTIFRIIGSTKDRHFDHCYDTPFLDSGHSPLPLILTAGVPKKRVVRLFCWCIDAPYRTPTATIFTKVSLWAEIWPTPYFEKNYKRSCVINRPVTPMPYQRHMIPFAATHHQRHHFF